ncbi:efflux RND transporter permease subunit [Polyangium jinanense]|uniref:Efflux RND transporter permease subunit n=1 Tax=Polyangium jinanense TaxID=2829994 RepID=A0A9X3X3L3_9BACT|nr:CusA/CzcA family heavy metal efflux RND transporter [Polyangium jinanense]MDC3962227.1 efflux RND transporter permease subunit [Polyangium jinanense]MDC3983619.1 efflux RND transporter permease subunit [Polyangium jinanense]
MAFLSAIVAWSLKNRAVVVAATILFALFGIRSATQLPIDAVPDVTNVQVQVITTAPALSPVEVEQYVSVPVERAMAGIPNTTEIRSISKYGLSVVTVVFRDGTDIYFARQLVNERMREAQEAVPAQYGMPEMGPISSGLGEIYQFAVRNDKLTLMQLEELLDWQIAPALRTVPGIVEVNSFGGEDKQYQIVLDPKRLQAAGISVAQVIEALEKSNANAGGGYIEHNREQFVIGSDGLVKNLDDLRRVVIGATSDGVPVTMDTVADVQFGPRLRRGAASKNGEGEVVVGVAMMLMGENSRTVTQAVKQRLAEIGPSLPEGTRIEPFYDRSVLVNRTIRTVATNLVEGALLVIGILFFLLGDLRAGLVVALVIPLSMLFAITVMNAAGLSGNLMSLGAIDLGLIVDGAVIIVENAVRRLANRQSELGRVLSVEERVDTVREATLEVRSASVFGEAIIAIVYLPILALTGIEGKLFHPMAITVLCALLGAFLLSLTFVPVLASYFIRPAKVEHETWLLRKAHALYVPLLRRAMRRRWIPLTAGVLALSAAAAVFTRVGAEFVPQLDEGDLLVEARRLPGIALSESVSTDLRLQKAIKEVPEVEYVVSRTGAPELATDPMGVEQSDVYVGLKPRGTWRPGIAKEDIAKEIAEAVEHKVPEVAGGVSQPIQMRTNELVAGVRSDVAVLLYGPDLDKLRDHGDRVAEIVRAIPGAEDVRVEQVAGLSYLRVIPDRGKLARYGLTVADVNQIVETMAVGHSTGEVMEGERRFGIVVKTGHGFTGELDALRALPLRSVSGQIVPLGDVAELKFLTGPAQVSRENQSRRLTVEFNVRGRDLLSVVAEAQAAVERGARLPTGYRAVWGGQFEHYEEAKARLLIVVPLALALILFLLWFAFRSTRTALLIFLGVPFATVGGIFALWLRGIPFSISAGVGFIALFGVAVLNGLVLVSFARHLEERGAGHAEAIEKAAEMRLRPVLMTALVASLGFVPMAISTAPGSEVQRPLATVVIGGLLTATLLTLLVLPVVYAWLGRERARP